MERLSTFSNWCVPVVKFVSCFIFLIGQFCILIPRALLLTSFTSKSEIFHWGIGIHQTSLSLPSDGVIPGSVEVSPFQKSNGSTCIRALCQGRDFVKISAGFWLVEMCSNRINHQPRPHILYGRILHSNTC